MTTGVGEDALKVCGRDRSASVLPLVKVNVTYKERFQARCFLFFVILRHGGHSDVNRLGFSGRHG
jgi:hypothetical protein